MAQPQQDNQALIWDLIKGSQHEEDALTESHEEDLREVFIKDPATQGFPELQEIYGNVGKSVPEFQYSVSDTQMMQVSSISRTCALADVLGETVSNIQHRTKVHMLQPREAQQSHEY